LIKNCGGGFVGMADVICEEENAEKTVEIEKKTYYEHFWKITAGKWLNIKTDQVILHGNGELFE
jgi:hypothetical protein